MRADVKAPRADAGFTLIEVLIAMLILAVGLLGLEAVAIGAARANARAERQTEHAFLANQYLESALSAIRADDPVVSHPDGTTSAWSYCSDPLQGGVRVSRQVTRVPLGTTPERYRVQVDVSVLDAATQAVRFAVSTSVFSASSLAPNGNACS